MKYENLGALDAAIEKIVKKNVRYYYTDWKNYDRPKYMSEKYNQKHGVRTTTTPLLLIVREYGTFLLNVDRRSSDICYYYVSQEGNSNQLFFLVDLGRVELKKITPEKAYSLYASIER